MLDRRQFIVSAGAAALLSGCAARRAIFSRTPKLRFGVISDIHLTTPRSCGTLKRTLRFMRRSGVDAVVIAGDLSDYGTKNGWSLLKNTWDDVFSGTDVVRLFCTGNHDVEGWRYGDMAADMFVNGQSGEDRITPKSCAEAWREVFGEDWSPVRLRKVKGWCFLSVEFGYEKELAGWMAENGRELLGEKPFFYFQHLPIMGTTADSYGWADNGVVKPILDAFPNAISFTGHTHRPYYDERSIWQGEFTTVATPSLSYASIPNGHENGKAKRDGMSQLAMPIVPARRDLRGGQGYLVDVCNECVVIGRYDFEIGLKSAADWEIPRPLCGNRPYEYGVRAESAGVPVFPHGSTVDISTVNTENRKGEWIIALECTFPSARIPEGDRVYDYELRVVLRTGAKVFAKHFFSPAFAEPESREPKMQRFWFDTANLPRGVDYRVEAVARNCFGRCGEAIASSWMHSFAPRNFD